MSTSIIIIVSILAVIFIYGLVQVIMNNSNNNELEDNLTKFEEDDFDNFMEESLNSKVKTGYQLRKELDLIEKSFNEPLDMTGLSGRSIVALKDLHVRDLNGLKQISVEHLDQMKGVGVKTIEDIQAWAMGSYGVEIK